ncbi:MAG: hypothetical protein MUE93_00785 [Ignavibacteriaceae bacterium]|jgi:hypothetical protein|nr:hypothetical protein [Ignavibacterium sp.]MCU0364199.1 hypothetical protein [Ignavibacteriaceae bacterium]
MNELINILKYRLVWLNFLLSFVFTVLSFYFFEVSALLFVLLSNLFDILGYHFSLIRRTKQLPEKIIIRSYRINQLMYDVLLLIIIGIQFDWIAAIAGWIMKLFGLQDILYYLFLEKNLPLNWHWMKWTPLGWFKSNLNRNEIIVQALIGILVALLLLILR